MQATTIGPTSQGAGLSFCASTARDLPHHAPILDGPFLAGFGGDLSRGMFCAALWSFAGPGGQCSPKDGEIAARLGYPDPESRAAGRWVQRCLQAGEGQDFRRVLGPDGRTRAGLVMIGPAPRFATDATPPTHHEKPHASNPTHDGEMAEDGNTSDSTQHETAIVAEVSASSVRQISDGELAKLRRLAVEMWRVRGAVHHHLNGAAREECVEFVRRLLDPSGKDPGFEHEAVEGALWWTWENGKPSRGPYRVIYDRAWQVGIPLRQATSFVPI